MWFDTLSMARALHGTEVGGSLGKLLEYYQVGITKGTYVVNAKGKHLVDFGLTDLQQYRAYCEDDVEGTYRLFMAMLPKIPKAELRQIDWVTRMFTEPKLYLDQPLLENSLKQIRGDKVRALLKAGVPQDELMSNEKFAEALRRLGVRPPEKISLTTGKPAYAFAKTDHQMRTLLEHEDPAVQAVVAARLKVKSTLAESRTIRMIDLAPRGVTPIYYKYSGAEQTMRLSGGDSMNWQNLTRGSALRDAIYADEGYTLVVIDSSNIEARVLDWLAGQEDAVEAYRRYDRGEGPDIYCVMASKLYQRQITPADKQERQLGKIVKLASGYQMGAGRFEDTARTYGVKLESGDAANAISTYREAHPMVVTLWNRAHSAIPPMAGTPAAHLFLDRHELLQVQHARIPLPNGLAVRYPKLSYDRADQGWTFDAGRGRTHLYGGKVVENLVQALARIIVMDQTIEIHKRYPVVMSTHDEIVALVKEEEAEAALAFGVACMSTSPKWAPTLPVAAKGAYARRYGEAK